MALRRGLVKLVLALVLVCVAGLALLAGVGFTLWALYLGVASVLGPAWGAFATGAGLLLTALILLANAARLSR